MTTWQPYTPNQHLGGLTIIKPLGVRTLTRHQRYLVRYDCCNETRELSHNAIRQRAKRGNTTCGTCQKRINGRTYGNPKRT